MVRAVDKIPPRAYAGSDGAIPEGDDRPHGDHSSPPEAAVVAAVVYRRGCVSVVEDVIKAAVMVGVIVGGNDVVKVTVAGGEEGVEVGEEIILALGTGSAVNEDARPVGADNELACALADINAMNLKLLGGGRERQEQGYQRNREHSEKRGFFHDFLSGLATPTALSLVISVPCDR